MAGQKNKTSKPKTETETMPKTETPEVGAGADAEAPETPETPDAPETAETPEVGAGADAEAPETPETPDVRTRAQELGDELNSAKADRDDARVRVFGMARDEVAGTKPDSKALARELDSARMTPEGYLGYLKQCEIRASQRLAMDSQTDLSEQIAEIEAQVSEAQAELKRVSAELNSRIKEGRQRVLELGASDSRARHAVSHLINSAPEPLRAKLQEARRLITQKSHALQVAQRTANGAARALADMENRVQATSEQTEEGKDARSRLADLRGELDRANQGVRDAESEVAKAEEAKDARVSACVEA